MQIRLLNRSSYVLGYIILLPLYGWNKNNIIILSYCRKNRLINRFHWPLIAIRYIIIYYWHNRFPAGFKNTHLCTYASYDTLSPRGGSDFTYIWITALWLYIYIYIMCSNVLCVIIIMICEKYQNEYSSSIVISRTWHNSCYQVSYTSIFQARLLTRQKDGPWYIE